MSLDSAVLKVLDYHARRSSLCDTVVERDLVVGRGYRFIEGLRDISPVLRGAYIGRYQCMLDEYFLKAVDDKPLGVAGLEDVRG